MIYEDEIWRPVECYDGLYEVSNYGNVKSSRREGTEGKILKPVYGNGYPTVVLSKNGNVKRFYVHRLVVTAFIGKIDEKMVVNHIDGNKENNKTENLEIVSNSDNILHASRTGLHDYGHWRGYLGDRNPNSKKYICISPEGVVQEVHGLRNFCKENGLSSCHMVSVSSGKRDHHKGWKCYKV